MSEEKEMTISAALEQANSKVSKDTDSEPIEKAETPVESGEDTEIESKDDNSESQENEEEKSSDKNDDDDDLSFDDEVEEKSIEETQEDEKRYFYERRQKEKAEKQVEKYQDKIDKLEEKLSKLEKEKSSFVETTITNKTVENWIENNPAEWDDLLEDFDEDSAKALIKRELKRDSKLNQEMSSRKQNEILNQQLNNFNSKYQKTMTLDDFGEINKRVGDNLTLEKLYQIDNFDSILLEAKKDGYRLARKDDENGRNRLAEKKKSSSSKKSSSPDASGSRIKVENLNDALSMARKKVSFK